MQMTSEADTDGERMIVKLPLERKGNCGWIVVEKQTNKQNKRDLIRSGPTPNEIANRFTEGKTK